LDLSVPPAPFEFAISSGVSESERRRSKLLERIKKLVLSKNKTAEEEKSQPTFDEMSMDELVSFEATLQSEHAQNKKNATARRQCRARLDTASSNTSLTSQLMAKTQRLCLNDTTTTSNINQTKKKKILIIRDK
jgi:hypothetical protein